MAQKGAGGKVGAIPEKGGGGARGSTGTGCGGGTSGSGSIGDRTKDKSMDGMPDTPVAVGAPSDNR